MFARLQKDVAGEVVLEDQGILMASAGLSDIEEIEVQKLRDTSDVNLLTEWARNLGATCRQSAYEADLNKRFDVGIHGSPAKLILDDVGGGRQSSVTSETAVGSNTNSKLQFFIIVGNEKLPALFIHISLVGVDERE